ncbi:MAG: M28 family peptidase [Planctomycetota bacterium]
MSYKRKTSQVNKNGVQDSGNLKSACSSKFHIRIITRNAVIRLAILAVVLTALCLWGCCSMTKMPGRSYTGQLPALAEAQILLSHELASDVKKLAGEIGERNFLNYKKLNDARDFIETSLVESGYKTCQQEYNAKDKTFYNIEAEKIGTKYPKQIIIVGAHYDSVYGSPGANDNGSGVAATLALARYFADIESVRTLRFLFFVNEEPPFYHTDQMGSVVYAKSCRTKSDNIIAMLCLETIGYYSDKTNSQHYPFPFSLIYPSTGNFVGFLSNFGSSRQLLYTAITSFRKNSMFPSEGGVIPEVITGINWSDHWSFWQHGYPAIMITDTAPFRYPYYHEPEDTFDKIDFDRLARVVTGLRHVIVDLDRL